MSSVQGAGIRHLLLFVGIAPFPFPSKCIFTVESDPQDTRKTRDYRANGSNLIVRASEFVEGLIRPWLIKTGIDTPNEHLHTLDIYPKDLKQSGFEHVQSKQ